MALRLSEELCNRFVKAGKWKKGYCQLCSKVKQAVCKVKKEQIESEAVNAKV